MHVLWCHDLWCALNVFTIILVIFHLHFPSIYHQLGCFIPILIYFMLYSKFHHRTWTLLSVLVFLTIRHLWHITGYSNLLSEWYTLGITLFYRELIHRLTWSTYYWKLNNVYYHLIIHVSSLGKQFLGTIL